MRGLVKFQTGSPWMLGGGRSRGYPTRKSGRHRNMSKNKMK